MANETILRATQAMRGRPVTSEEAHESVSRLIARAHNGPGPKSTMSIPVSPFDDDVLLTDYLLELEAKLKAVQDDFNLVMQGLAAPFGECFTLPDGNCIGRGCMHDRDADKLKAAEDALRANCLGCKNNWRMIGESNDHEGRNKDGTWFFHRCTNGSKLRAALNAVTRQPLNGGGEQ